MPHRVFISYSYDGPEHEAWVARLANALQVQADVDVRFDRYELWGGKDLLKFMEDAVGSDRVLMVLTPQYKKKSESRTGGVGYESILITAEVYRDSSTDKFVPVLRFGEWSESTPAFMGNRFGTDARNDTEFDEKVAEILKAIRREPAIPRPVKSTSHVPELEREASMTQQPGFRSNSSVRPRLEALVDVSFTPTAAILDLAREVADLVRQGKWSTTIGMARPKELSAAVDRYRGRVFEFEKAAQLAGGVCVSSPRLKTRLDDLVSAVEGLEALVATAISGATLAEIRSTQQFREAEGAAQSATSELLAVLDAPPPLPRLTPSIGFVAGSHSRDSHDFHVTVYLQNISNDPTDDYKVEVHAPTRFLSGARPNSVMEALSTGSLTVLRLPQPNLPTPRVFLGSKEPVVSFQYRLTPANLADASAMSQAIKVAVLHADGHVERGSFPISDLHDCELWDGGLKKRTQ